MKTKSMVPESVISSWWSEKCSPNWVTSIRRESIECLESTPWHRYNNRWCNTIVEESEHSNCRSCFQLNAKRQTIKGWSERERKPSSRTYHSRVEQYRASDHFSRKRWEKFVSSWTRAIELVLTKQNEMELEQFTLFVSTTQDLVGEQTSCW